MATSAAVFFDRWIVAWHNFAVALSYTTVGMHPLQQAFDYTTVVHTRDAAATDATLEWRKLIT
jgi:hypothetical protein